jgi:hypothetical protein
MVLLGWAKSIAGVFADPDRGVGKAIAIAVAIFAVFLVDFSVNASACRSRSDARSGFC